MLRRMVVGSGTVRDASTHAHQQRVRRRLEAQLRIHYDASLPDCGHGATVSGPAAAPRWRLRCDRAGGSLRELTRKYIQLCNEHAEEVRHLGPKTNLVHSE